MAYRNSLTCLSIILLHYKNASAEQVYQNKPGKYAYKFRQAFFFSREHAHAVGSMIARK